jgi:acetyltransferase-like isoleucine patch superfamily enzyme
MKFKAIGNNCIISEFARFRYPELVTIGNDVIVDDFVYVSTQLTIGDKSHISAGCKIIGGRDSEVKIGCCSGLAPNVTLVAGTDDYHAGIYGGTEKHLRGKMVIGSILIGHCCVIGAGSTVLTNVSIENFVSVGAQSLVCADLKSYGLYFGIPAKRRKSKKVEEIKSLLNLAKNESSDWKCLLDRIGF